MASVNVPPADSCENEVILHRLSYQQVVGVTTRKRAALFCGNVECPCEWRGFPPGVFQHTRNNFCNSLEIGAYHFMETITILIR